MASRKQEIYCALLYDGLIHIRFLCGRGARLSAEEALNFQGWFEVGWEEANFLHHVHNSILDPEYVENDISFINFAFPCHISRMGHQLGGSKAALMLEFYEGVPEALHPQLTWHPSKEFRVLAAQGRGE
ncbi:hypothetical protein [Gemmata sp.]|uniref:hypothetical protein n=1 Tax=Gemmata sp. TaxID=1914242 RepID=UPI003F729FFC